jgi:hypothetical protein
MVPDRLRRGDFTQLKRLAEQPITEPHMDMLFVDAHGEPEEGCKDSEDDSHEHKDERFKTGSVRDDREQKDHRCHDDDHEIAGLGMPVCHMGACDDNLFKLSSMIRVIRCP